MDSAKQIYVLWLLMMTSSAKHLPTSSEGYTENQRYQSLSPKIELAQLETTYNIKLSTDDESIESSTGYIPTINYNLEENTDFYSVTEDVDNEEKRKNKSNPDTNSIHKMIAILDNDGKKNDTRLLKRVFLSNRSIVCNDGSQAGFYLRKSLTGSPVWIVFLEGGWYCYDRQSCRNRWLKLRHLMTSSQWPDSRDVNGILSANPTENPYWHNANHVIIPYCSSDTWSGTTSPSNVGKDQFHFMGKLIALQVIKDLIPLGLQNSTQLIFAGSSAGGTGVMINLDPVQHLLHAELGLKHIAVRGISDSGWFLDRTPYSPSILPAVDAIKKGYSLWQGSLPKRCADLYRDEPWRCYFGYRVYPTLRAPLFVFQWLFDEAQMTADNVGAPVTPQQWDYIHRMGNASRASLRDVTALFAPSCVSHSVLTKREWLRVSIDDVTVAQAIRCWEIATTKKPSKNQFLTPNSKPARKLVRSGVSNHRKIVDNISENSDDRQKSSESNKGFRLQNKRRRRKKIDDKNGKRNNTMINGDRNRNKNRNDRNNQERNRSNPKQAKQQQNQRRKNNSNNNNNNRKKNSRSNHKRGNSHNCPDEGNLRHNQRVQANRRGPLKCDNANIRRHVRNRNKSIIRHSNQSLHHSNNNNSFGIVANAVMEESKKFESEAAISFSTLTERQMRLQRSLLRDMKSPNSGCEHRHIERCTWPQCNHSCPRLIDPYTGDEIHFIDMLKSFGLEMESVAQELGVDMQTLNNMEHAELLNLLTQQSN